MDPHCARCCTNNREEKDDFCLKQFTISDRRGQRNIAPQPHNKTTVAVSNKTTVAVSVIHGNLSSQTVVKFLVSIMKESRVLHEGLGIHNKEFCPFLSLFDRDFHLKGGTVMVHFLLWKRQLNLQLSLMESFVVHSLAVLRVQSLGSLTLSSSCLFSFPSSLSGCTRYNLCGPLAAA